MSVDISVWNDVSPMTYWYIYSKYDMVNQCKRTKYSAINSSVSRLKLKPIIVDDLVYGQLDRSDFTSDLSFRPKVGQTDMKLNKFWLFKIRDVNTFWLTQAKIYYIGIWSYKVPFLSHLVSIWPNFGPNRTSQPESAQYNMTSQAWGVTSNVSVDIS